MVPSRPRTVAGGAADLFKGRQPRVLLRDPRREAESKGAGQDSAGDNDDGQGGQAPAPRAQEKRHVPAENGASYKRCERDRKELVEWKRREPL